MIDLMSFSRFIPIALLALSPHFFYGQGRQNQSPAQTQTAPGGRGGRGPAGPGQAVGGEIDETPSVTHHSIQVGGKSLNYTATVAQMPIIRLIRPSAPSARGSPRKNSSAGHTTSTNHMKPYAPRSIQPGACCRRKPSGVHIGIQARKPRR